MRGLSEQPDGFVMERVFSPDRRLALDYLPYPDPRTQYEADNPEAVALRDAQTGERLAEFGGWSMVARHKWPEAGGVELELLRGVRLRIAPDLATFAAGEPPVTQPIAALPGWLCSLTAPPSYLPPSPSAATSRFARWATAAALLIVLAVGYATYRLLDRSREAPVTAAASQINDWIVNCPGVGWTPMVLTDDGRLAVPRAIAPAPLPPMEGGEGGARRFGDAWVMVEVDGARATLWPDGPGGRALPCPPRARGAGN